MINFMDSQKFTEGTIFPSNGNLKKELQLSWKNKAMLYRLYAIGCLVILMRCDAVKRSVSG